jgi:hypothetical protein
VRWRRPFLVGQSGHASSAHKSDVMRRRVGPALALVIIGLSLPCCNRDSGTRPTRSEVVAGAQTAGSYSGSVQNTFQGTGVMHMTLAQSGSTLSGTWSATFLGVGLLTGSVSGNSIAVTLLPDNPTPCPDYNATATLEGNRLTGAYTSLNCPRAVAGDLVALRTRDADFSLVKQ